MSSADSSVAEAFLNDARGQLAEAMKTITHCVDQLTDEQVGWRPGESMNSIGNLLLHLGGNVRQWIVSGVGGRPDTRVRQEEFDKRGPFRRADLLRQLEAVVAEATDVLRLVTAAQLLEPRRIQGFETNGLSAINHSVSHFRGHAQEIAGMTRQQLGNGYRFEWVPTSAEEGAPSAE